MSEFDSSTLSEALLEEPLCSTSTSSSSSKSPSPQKSQEALQETLSEMSSENGYIQLANPNEATCASTKIDIMDPEEGCVGTISPTITSSGDVSLTANVDNVYTAGTVQRSKLFTRNHVNLCCVFLCLLYLGGIFYMLFVL